jgi:hypothetical protein
MIPESFSRQPSAPLTHFVSDAVRVQQFAALGQKLFAKFEQLPPGGRLGPPSRAGVTRELFGHGLPDKLAAIARNPAHIQKRKSDGNQLEIVFHGHVKIQRALAAFS